MKYIIYRIRRRWKKEKETTTFRQIISVELVVAFFFVIEKCEHAYGFAVNGPVFFFFHWIEKKKQIFSIS